MFDKKSIPAGVVTTGSLFGDHEIFLGKIFDNLRMVGFSGEEFREIDHLAYRTETLERYEELKNEFEKFSSNVSEVMISGRHILVCKLKNPLIYGEWEIHCIELCAPKENNKYTEGLEHAEFVTKEALEDFMQKHADLEFNMKAFKKETNRELILDFKDCAVKFHEQSLLEVRGM